MSVGHRLLTTLREKGIAQKDLAAQLGITQAAVSAWGWKGVSPPSKYISKIAKILGVSVNYLLTGVDDISLTPISADDEITVLRKLVVSQQETIASQARSLEQLTSEKSPRHKN